MPDIDMFADETGGATVTLTKKEKQRVEYLERVLTVLARLHGEGLPTKHPDSGEIVSDLEFDTLWAELEKLDASATARLGNASAPAFDPNAKKMKHEPPMTSIKKANGTLAERNAAFEKWVADIMKEFGWNRDQTLKQLVVSYKHDGVACSIKYVNGELVQAGLRPHDGVWGEDVTENIKYVSGIPTRLKLPLSIVIRGELECRISTFNKLNGTAAVESQEFANPRNYTTGSIRQHKDPVKTKSRQLSFEAYNIIGHENPPYKTERERAKWANQELGIRFVRTEFYTPTLFEELELHVPNLDYEVDGAVISLNSFDNQEQMGVYGSAANAIPKGKLAWKFDDEKADPPITDIVYETGRTGQVTPVVHFNGVKLAGTTVVKASAHSLGFLMRNNIRVGTQIRIRKSGKIIPEVMGWWENGVYNDKREAGDPNLPATFDLTLTNYPKACPSCEQPTRVDEGGTHGMFTLVCDNKDCPSQNIKRYLNYLEKFGVKGVGESSVTSMVESNLVRSFSDFYSLKASSLMENGWSMREALLDVARIHMVDAPEQEKDNQVLGKRIIAAVKQKKVISLAKFLSTLGMPGAGKGTGTALALHFRDLDAILNATEQELSCCADVGATTAATVCNYLKEHRDDLDTLVKDYLQIELPKSGKYSNKTFVFTGGQPEGKEYWKDAVEAEGGIVKGSVSKKTDYVIVGTDPGEKADKAKALKDEGHPITIVDDHDQLVRMFQ